MPSRTFEHGNILRAKRAGLGLVDAIAGERAGGDLFATAINTVKVMKVS